MSSYRKILILLLCFVIKKFRDEKALGNLNIYLFFIVTFYEKEKILNFDATKKTAKSYKT